MDLSQQKQAFSKAYVRAVAAKSGFDVYAREVDDDSIDIGFASGAGLTRRPYIDAQLKCSADDPLRTADFSFTLSRKNYDDLRADTLVPRILIVVRVPVELDHWLEGNEDHLLVRHCGYWRSLLGSPDRASASVTIRMHRAKQFDSEQLTDLMARAQAGDPL